ncbi:MAG: hypothetical protein ABJJ69_21990 [Paracoccaceae bacterium]
MIDPIQFTKMMGIPNPKGESAKNYCNTLEELGFDEIFIRKALMAIFELSYDTCTACFNDLERAKLKYIAMIVDHKSHPNRTPEGLIMKVARSLGTSTEEAAEWIARVDASEDLTYLDWFPRTRKNFHHA